MGGASSKPRSNVNLEVPSPRGHRLPPSPHLSQIVFRCASCFELFTGHHHRFSCPHYGAVYEIFWSTVRPGEEKRIEKVKLDRQRQRVFDGLFFGEP